MVSLVAQLFIETARAVAGSAFARRESNPLDRGERFQLVLTIIPPSCSPDASAMRRAYCALRSPPARDQFAGVMILVSTGMSLAVSPA